ncbi:TetR/AcrR family transcriptional regulator [Streptomyces sp. NPDC057743]|uniref:TetR/AcrR family transcriptional regulator n=1 Tax=Streptomyces sp. NPDC057743 TaxID=3346236 RepID=UPI0036B013F1
MRADAARNLDAVLQTGARLLANDPSTSIATIAAQAGVDRRTVYRRFATREALMAGVYAAKLAACEDVCEQARLTEAPVTVALHRYAEGIITASRKWPVDLGRATDEAATARLHQLLLRLDAFLARAVHEGVIRPGLPDRWARALLTHLTNMASHEMPELTPAQGADLVTHSLLAGLGTGAPQGPAPTPAPAASASAQPKGARTQTRTKPRPKSASRKTA